MRNLSIVIGESTSGELEVLYLGRERAEAQEAVAAAVAKGELQEVVHVDRPKFARRKRPRHMKEEAARSAAEAQEEAAGEVTEAAGKKAAKKKVSSSKG